MPASCQYKEDDIVEIDNDDNSEDEADDCYLEKTHYEERSLNDDEEKENLNEEDLKIVNDLVEAKAMQCLI